MFNVKWSARHITDSAQRILKQIPSRAGDRGLHVVDSSSIVMMALWSLLHWERKVGRISLERLGVDPYELARGLDRILEKKAADNPVIANEQHVLVLADSKEPYKGWDFDSLLEPLLRQAEHEALELQHNYVGSEHLVLAIIRLADPAMAGLLEQYSITHDRVRQTVQELLQP